MCSIRLDDHDLPIPLEYCPETVEELTRQYGPGPTDVMGMLKLQGRIPMEVSYGGEHYSGGDSGDVASGGGSNT